MSFFRKKWEVHSDSDSSEFFRKKKDAEDYAMRMNWHLFMLGYTDNEEFECYKVRYRNESFP